MATPHSRGLLLLAALLTLAAVPGIAEPTGDGATDPTPTERKTDRVEVTLGGVRTGMSSRDLRTPAARGEARWTRVDLRLTVNGVPSRLWLPQQLRIHGAGGRLWAPTRLVSYFGRDGEGCVAFPDPHPHAAAGWRFQLELARSNRYLPYEFWNVFKQDELWTVPLVGVPKPQEAERGNTHASTVMREGVRLRLVRMAGARVPTPAGLAVKAKAPNLQVRYSPPVPGLNVTLVRATDFSGRLVPMVAPPVLEPAGRSDSERSILFSLKPQKDARLVNATFAVHKSRYVELTAQAGPGAATAAE